MNCLTVDVGLEDGVEVGFDVVGTGVGMELEIADGCAGMIYMFRGYHDRVQIISASSYLARRRNCGHSRRWPR
jgi:hypothetical protein